MLSLAAVNGFIAFATHPVEKSANKGGTPHQGERGQIQFLKPAPVLVLEAGSS